MTGFLYIKLYDHRKSKMHILFLDTETTGLSCKPGMHEIIQLAGIFTENRHVIDTFFCKPQPRNWDKINKQALQVTNLSIDILKKYDDPKQSFDAFYQFIQKNYKGTPIRFAGQKINFDMKFINLWWNTWKSPEQLPIEHFFDMAIYYDLLDVTKPLNAIGLLVTDNLKLGTICEALNLKPVGNLHDAFTDIEITYRAMFELIDRVKSLNNDDVEDKIKKFMYLV